MQQKLTLTTPSGDKIATRITRDESKSKQKLVFISGGFGSTKDSDRQVGLCQFFADLGFAIFQADFLGCGESSGDRAYTTISKGLEIIDTAFAYILQQTWVDEKYIGLYGNSYGGMLSVQEAARHNNRYNFVILASPAQYIENIEVDIEKWRKQEIMNVIRQPRHISFYDDLLKYDSYQAAEKIKCPVLIMHGVDDEVIPFDQTIKLNKHLSNSTLIPMIGEKHRYQNFEPFEKAMTQWLQKLS